MADRDFLVFPRPVRERRPPLRGGGGGGLRLPDRARQTQRISPRIAELEAAFEARRIALQADAAGAAPEEVLVLETAGTVEAFVRAVQRTPGMEWLVESDELDLDADDDFGRSEEDPEGAYRGRLYLVMADQQAIAELLRLWRTFTEQGAWPWGGTPWRDVFAQLRDVRLWGPEDRLFETGLIQDWQQRIERGTEDVPLEIELWFRRDGGRRNQSEVEIGGMVRSLGGRVVGAASIPEIAFHAVLARVPIESAQQIISRQDVALVRSGEVMFLRPVGQTSIVVPADAEASVFAEPIRPGPQGNPLIALLDGLPMANHQALAGRLTIDDPDNWSASYTVPTQRHGTAMASIITRGDLNVPGVELDRPVYVRPIMKPNLVDPNLTESIPDEELPVDLVHRAVRRLFESVNGEQPVAPSVRIINISVGDSSRPFDTLISPWARLLDWLSWRYNVLFVVSAGNCVQDLELPGRSLDLEALTAPDRDKLVIQALWNDARNRRLLSPAEGVNVLTVASTNDDDSTNPIPNTFQMLTSAAFPSPLNPIGLGPRRSVKPDILAKGGRQAYSHVATRQGPVSVMRPNPSHRSPGVLVATPSLVPGDTGGLAHMRGTSNSAALVSRTAVQSYRLLEDLDARGQAIPEPYRSVLTKALVVHASRWTAASASIRNALGTDRQRERLTRFFGFGALDESRVLTATDQRATLLGWGDLAHDESEVFTLPLPPSLSGARLLRRVTLTLAWFSPVNPYHRAYRQAELRIGPATPESDASRVLDLSRVEVDNRLVYRGTVQHEIFEGERAVAFADGDSLTFRVSCREMAGRLQDRIRYGLAVSLEAGAPLNIAIYDEVAARIRPQVRIVGQP